MTKFDEIWIEVKKVIVRKNFDGDPVFSGKYLNTKIKSYNNKITTNFQNVKKNSTKPPKERPRYVCLSQLVLILFSNWGKVIIQKHF